MGIAKIKLRETIAANLLSHRKGFHPMSLINLLSNLPENTRVVGMEDKGIDGLSLLTEISVENPIFEDGAEIVAQYDREVAPNSDKDSSGIYQFVNPRGLDIRPALKKFK